MVKTMSQPIVDAAKKAGISTDRAEEIYSMKILGREFCHGGYVDLNLTSKEHEWIIDVHEMLSRDGSTWQPKEYHQFEKKEKAIHRIYNAIGGLLGEDDIACASYDQLRNLIAYLNEVGADICGDPRLSMDETDKMAQRLYNYGEIRSSELIDEWSERVFAKQPG